MGGCLSKCSVLPCGKRTSVDIEDRDSVYRMYQRRVHTKKEVSHNQEIKMETKKAC